MSRKLHEIASDIQRDWGENVSYAAAPHLSALMFLDNITDKYYADDASTVVLYFLSNAGGWRGETARRIKSELKQLLREVK